MEERRIEFRSRVDGSVQPARLVPAAVPGPRPLLVCLHQWSGTMHAGVGEWFAAGHAAGLHVLAPDFRGPNNRPEACGSPEAQGDVLDAVEAARGAVEVEAGRVLLAGASGGGHMAMLMAGRAPGHWAAVSAWVGISDLARWHGETKARGLKYWRDIEGVVGGAPGSSEEVDRELAARSPVTHLGAAAGIPLDLAAGIHDGHGGASVPVGQTLRAFNAVARANGDEPVCEEDIARLEGRELPLEGKGPDREFGVPVYFRRESGRCRVSLFEGGHTALEEVAVAWLLANSAPGRTDR